LKLYGGEDTDFVRSKFFDKCDKSTYFRGLEIRELNFYKYYKYMPALSG